MSRYHSLKILIQDITELLLISGRDTVSQIRKDLQNRWPDKYHNLNSSIVTTALSKWRKDPEKYGYELYYVTAGIQQGKYFVVPVGSHKFPLARQIMFSQGMTSINRRTHTLSTNSARMYDNAAKFSDASPAVKKRYVIISTLQRTVARELEEVSKMNAA